MKRGVLPKGLTTSEDPLVLNGDDSVADVKGLGFGGGRTPQSCGFAQAEDFCPDSLMSTRKGRLLERKYFLVHNCTNSQGCAGSTLRLPEDMEKRWV